MPLGAQVTDCVQVSDDFIYCHYNGLWGYIQVEYLSALQSSQPAVNDGGTTFAALSALPSYEAFMAAGSDLLVHETYAGYTIVVRRAYSTVEEMMAVCYNLSLVPLWELRENGLYELSEVPQTSAFTGGVTEDALLIWYIQGKGFFAYEYGPQLKMRWALPENTSMNITNCILPKVDDDGTLYAAFDDKLLCISREGQLLWKASCDDDGIYAPMDITLTENYVDVTYDNYPETGNVVTMVRFSKDGFVLLKTPRVVSVESMQNQ